MKYIACAVLTVFLATLMVQAAQKLEPKKFCLGENGIKYGIREGYKEGCTKFICVKRGKQMKMFSKPTTNCGNSSTPTHTTPDKICSRWTTPVGGCLWNNNYDPITNVSSIESCQRKCTDTSWCRSVDYIVDRRECYLNWETAFSKLSAWYSVCYSKKYPEIFRSSVYSEKVEIRPGSPTMSSVYSASYSAERCMDGYLDTYCYNKEDGDEKPFFMIEYTELVRVNQVRLITAESYPQHAKNIVVTVTNDTTSSGTQFGPIYKGPATKGGEVINFQPKTAVMGKYVIVEQDKGVITFAEVKVKTG